MRKRPFPHAGEPRYAGSINDAVVAAQSLALLPVAFTAIDTLDSDMDIVVVARTETEFQAAAEEAFRYDLVGRIRIEHFGPTYSVDISSAESAVAFARNEGYPVRVVPHLPTNGAALSIVAYTVPQLTDAVRKALAVSTVGLVGCYKLKRKARGG